MGKTIRISNKNYEWLTGLNKVPNQALDFLFYQVNQRDQEIVEGVSAKFKDKLDKLDKRLSELEDLASRSYQ